jgi:hypothetical protein
MLASYAAGMLRPLTSEEAGSADRAMLSVGIFAGAALAAADGIRNWQRLNKVLTVLVGCGAVVAAIGVVQFVTLIDLTQYMQIPGLQQKHEVIGFEERGEAIRVASTTTHYIELATVLTMILPFAVHQALFGETRRGRRWGIIASVLLAGGMFATVSRTGMLALLIVGVMLLPTWTWRLRYNVLVVAGMFGVALTVLKPSLVLTLTSLFDDPSSNPAFTVRQDRYPMVWAFVSERPWFGRGTGTYVSPQYQFLDNEWLAHLISNGIVGVLAFAAMHIIGIVIALRAARRATTRELRHLCTGVAATQVVAMVSAVTFDSMSFLTHALVTALTLGLCGTVWRLTHPDAEIRTAMPRAFASSGPSVFLRQYIVPERAVSRR